MEDLRKVAPTLRVAKLRPLDPASDDPASPQTPPAAHEGERRAAQALSAYGRVQHPPVDRRPLQRVGDVMHPDPVVLRQHTTVRQGWWTLYDHGVGQAPVVNEAGAVVGLLSRAELMQPERLPRPDGLAIAWQALMAQSVTQVMVSPVPCATPETDLRRLAQVLEQLVQQQVLALL
jgi:CBS-domain-containing membrane protein